MTTKTTASVSAKKASRKPARSRSAGGSAAQTILNIITTLLTVPGVVTAEQQRKEVPRTMVVQFATTQGVHGKSTFANALTKLKKEQKIVVHSNSLPSMIEITTKGLTSAQPIHDLSAQTNEDYQHKVIFTQHQLTGNTLRLVKVLQQDGGKHQYSKKHLCVTILGLKMNSTWSNMLTKLKKLNIIMFDRDTIQLSDAMFPLGRDHRSRAEAEAQHEHEHEHEYGMSTNTDTKGIII